MTFAHRMVLAAGVTMCSMPAMSQSSDYAELCAGHKAEVRLGTCDSGKRVVLVDGQPRPLHWANLTHGDEDYGRAGFNTIFAELRHRAPEGSTSIVPVEEFYPQWDAALLEISPPKRSREIEYQKFM